MKNYDEDDDLIAGLTREEDLREEIKAADLMDWPEPPQLEIPTRKTSLTKICDQDAQVLTYALINLQKTWKSIYKVSDICKLVEMTATIIEKRREALLLAYGTKPKGATSVAQQRREDMDEFDSVEGEKLVSNEDEQLMPLDETNHRGYN